MSKNTTDTSVKHFRYIPKHFRYTEKIFRSKVKILGTFEQNFEDLVKFSEFCNSTSTNFNVNRQETECNLKIFAPAAQTFQ